MLAEIAHGNFISNNLFFQQGEVANQIEKILREMLIEKKQIDGKSVLRAVEEQHGILVNRHEDIYSFSHLTLQEFFTAKHIIDNNLNLNDLVTKHLCDERWREVFLLLGGLRKADDLLLAIERKIWTYINKFIQYAKWSVEFEIYRELDLENVINELEILKNRIPDENQSEQAHHSFDRELIKIWLTGFGLNPNMVNFSKEEIKALDNYLYANQLLVECERAAVRRSPEVWSQIESRMFRLA